MSTVERNYVESLLNEYQEKPKSKLEELRELDKKAKKGAKIFSLIFGIIGSLVLGLGMCIAMKIILQDLMIIGIIIGLIGIFMVSINYKLYKKLLIKGKNKYAEEIKRLSKEILNEQE